MTDLQWRDRHILITGAGSGIGAAIAAAAAATGARVSLAGRRIEPLAAVQQSLIGETIQIIADFDITQPVNVDAGVAAARAAFGSIDVLVNNAGAVTSAAFLKTDLAHWNQTLAVNLIGPVLVTQAVIAEMLGKRYGRIINIASTAGLIGYRYVSAYVAAKHAIVGLTRSLALEYAQSGVTVNAVCPGYSDTPLVAAALDTIVSKTGKSREAALASLTSTNPQRRLVKPEEIADAVMWLASEGASAINGQAIAVAGGEVMVG
jgi:NAD(P)-dependent dehydrogenase (short-subunit alcohol dehydrogenase family)